MESPGVVDDEATEDEGAEPGVDGVHGGAHGPEQLEEAGDDDDRQRGAEVGSKERVIGLGFERVEDETDEDGGGGEERTEEEAQYYHDREDHSVCLIIYSFMLPCNETRK